SAVLDPNIDAGHPGHSQGLGGAHSRALQPVFPGADWAGPFASASSAPSSPLGFNGLARTVSTGSFPRPSASLATVRKLDVTKPWAERDSDVGGDEGEGGEGRPPPRPGAGSADPAVIQMIGVRARPSRSKPISTPILRNEVAARRSRPASPRGLS